MPEPSLPGTTSVPGAGARRGKADATTSRFEADTKAAVARIRASLGRFLEGLGEPMRRPADLQKALGVDKALGWQTFRTWSATDPLDAAMFVPRPVPMARILDAGRERGVRPEVIDAVSSACVEFETFVERVAGDRSTFESMVGGLAQGTPRKSLRDRRNAYRALSRLWGILAQAQINCSIFSPRHASLGDCDMAFVRGYVGVQQLRSNATFRVSSRSAWKSDTGAAGEPPADTQADGAQFRADDDTLLEEFCSRPLPTFTTSEDPAAGLGTTLDFNGIGRASAVTFFLRRQFHYHQSTLAQAFETNIISPIPTQVMLLDLLVPAGLSDAATGSANVYGNLFAPERGWDARASDRLPFAETTSHLGRSLDHLHTPDFPKYPEMIGSVLDDLGWRGTQFDIYRCRVEYPVLHGCVHVKVEARHAGT